jgi:hypothetical protein
MNLGVNVFSLSRNPLIRDGISKGADYELSDLDSIQIVIAGNIAPKLILSGLK